MVAQHRLALVGAAVEQVRERNLLGARAMQQHMAHALGQFLERRFHIKAVVLAQALQHRKVITVASIPALDGAAGQTQRRKRHHARRVEHFLLADAVARRAGAGRRVEREQSRLQLR
ncbi:hypothetical protein SDC9_114798 [bioreactor metagenome]|uniref:Uncharacterized protein n=1 Tax=bioreactor metagenome TaxID=1076179 RepID=A0A645BXN2_9ZZZZ